MCAGRSGRLAAGQRESGVLAGAREHDPVLGACPWRSSRPRSDGVGQMRLRRSTSHPAPEVAVSDRAEATRVPPATADCTSGRTRPSCTRRAGRPRPVSVQAVSGRPMLCAMCAGRSGVDMPEGRTGCRPVHPEAVHAGPRRVVKPLAGVTPFHVRPCRRSSGFQRPHRRRCRRRQTRRWGRVRGRRAAGGVDVADSPRLRVRAPCRLRASLGLLPVTSGRPRAPSG